jgi:hypothetical protein
MGDTCELVSGSFEGLKPDDYKGYDAVYRPLEKGSDSNGLLQYIIFNRNALLPEYFIEYSMESDWDRYTTQLEKLLVGITLLTKTLLIPTVFHTLKCLALCRSYHRRLQSLQ